MKVLMFGPSLDAPGGMSAVALAYRDVGLFERFQVEYISTYEGPGLQQLRVFPAAVWRALRALAGGGITLIHVHSASRGSFWRKSIICAIARMLRVPYVFHVHSGEFLAFYAKGSSALSRVWIRKTLRRAHTVIALTNHWLRSLQSIEPDARYAVVPNPVDVPEQLGEMSEGEMTVLFLGRLTEKKGAFDLVKAIPRVLSHTKDVRFVLAGDGDIDALRALAETLGIERNIETPGWIDGEVKAHAIARSHVLVLPSYFEGLPMCVLEAMAQGIPVVASRVGGIPDVIEDGSTGSLVTPGDTEGIAAALVHLLESAHRRDRMRRNAHAVAFRTFAAPRVAELIASEYSRCAMGIEGR